MLSAPQPWRAGIARQAIARAAVLRCSKGSPLRLLQRSAKGQPLWHIEGQRVHPPPGVGRQGGCLCAHDSSQGRARRGRRCAARNQHIQRPGQAQVARAEGAPAGVVVGSSPGQCIGRVVARQGQRQSSRVPKEVGCALPVGVTPSVRCLKGIQQRLHHSSHVRGTGQRACSWRQRHKAQRCWGRKQQRRVRDGQRVKGKD